MEKYFELYLHLQCNFNKQICHQIFENLADHIWQKWLTSENNILFFINRLDAVNRSKVYEWMKNNKK